MPSLLACCAQLRDRAHLYSSEVRSGIGAVEGVGAIIPDHPLLLRLPDSPPAAWPVCARTSCCYLGPRTSTVVGCGARCIPIHCCLTSGIHMRTGICRLNCALANVRLHASDPVQVVALLRTLLHVYALHTHAKCSTGSCTFI